MKFEDHKTLSFTNWCVENRTTIYIFTFIITLTGLVVYNNLPKEQFPDIKIPQIYINTVYFGTAPADVEKLAKAAKDQKKDAVLLLVNRGGNQLFVGLDVGQA